MVATILFTPKLAQSFGHLLKDPGAYLPLRLCPIMKFWALTWRAKGGEPADRIRLRGLPALSQDSGIRRFALAQKARLQRDRAKLSELFEWRGFLPSQLQDGRICPKFEVVEIY